MEYKMESKLNKNVWKFTSNPIEFEAMKNGLKTVEGRSLTLQPKESNDYRNIKVGDEIKFTDRVTEEVVTVIVTANIYYPNLSEYFENEGLKNCLPWVNSLEEGIKYYSDLSLDYDDRIKSSGIQAIRMKVCPPPL